MPKARLVDLTAVAICTLSWGTTWFAITFQLGTVDPGMDMVPALLRERPLEDTPDGIGEESAEGTA